MYTSLPKPLDIVYTLIKKQDLPISPREYVPTERRKMQN